jgi:hypothetical protein
LALGVVVSVAVLVAVDSDIAGGAFVADLVGRCPDSFATYLSMVFDD